MAKRLSTQFINELEDMIRTGRSREAASALQGLLKRSAEWSRADRLRLANLARRAYVPALGLMLLRPFVRPSDSRPVEAKPDERIEFAACLIAVGARREGRTLLESIDPVRFPLCDLFTSFALFSEWDYASAIPRLERYVRHPAHAPYAVLVGKANLAAALVHERRHVEAKPLLDELNHATRSGGHALLLQNVLKIEAESAIDTGDFVRADQRLSGAYELSGRSPEENLYIEKWQAIARWKQRSSGEARAALLRVREKALQLGEWEGVRDCDYVPAVQGKDIRLGMKLYAGTPYEAYRKRLLGDFPELASAVRMPYRWSLGGGAETRPAGSSGEDVSGHQIDEIPDAASHSEIFVANGKNSTSKLFLKANQVQQRLLNALASDFYRPSNLVELHALVFPAQHFHPKASADSMHQAFRRLRGFLEKARVPLRITENRGRYQLEATKPIELVIMPRASAVSGAGEKNQSTFALDARLEHDFHRLQKSLSEGVTALEAARIWKISRNSALNRLRRLREAGLLRREGAARGIRYRVP
jgi:hypothetical protein